MILSISGYSPQAIAESSLAPSTNSQAPQPAQDIPTDTVTLSQGAQISQLSQQGESPSTISQSLGVSVATVNLDLGITTASTIAAPAAQAPAKPHAAPAPTAPASSPAVATAPTATPTPVIAATR